MIKSTLLKKWLYKAIQLNSGIVFFSIGIQRHEQVGLALSLSLYTYFHFFRIKKNCEYFIHLRFKYF